LEGNALQNREAGHDQEVVVEVGPAQKTAGDKKSDKTEPKHVAVLDQSIVARLPPPPDKPAGGGESAEHDPEIDGYPDKAMLAQHLKVDAMRTVACPDKTPVAHVHFFGERPESPPGDWILGR